MKIFSTGIEVLSTGMEALPWNGRLACPAGGKVGGPLRVAKAEGPLPCIHPRGHAILCAFCLCAFCGGLLTPFAPRVGLRPFCRILHLRQELFFPETAPTIPFQTQFDWVSYTPEVSSAIRPRRVPSAVHKTSAVVDLQGRLFEKAPGKGFFLEKR